MDVGDDLVRVLFLELVYNPGEPSCCAGPFLVDISLDIISLFIRSAGPTMPRAMSVNVPGAITVARPAEAGVGVRHGSSSVPASSPLVGGYCRATNGY